MKLVDSAVDILILSNGPGELATWVKPVLRALRDHFGDDRGLIRISIILSPCNNASGQEAAIARRFPEVDRVQGAEHFSRFLLSGMTAENWDWRQRGVVLFLGGDQFFPVVIGKRLGYRTVVYAEWDARWHRWIDRFGVMRPEIIQKANPRYAHKFAVVGDLMAEAGNWNTDADPFCPDPPLPDPSPTLIGLLPGSKAMKLTLGLPLLLAIAEQIHYQNPNTRFVIPVAPTLDRETLATFANPSTNPVIRRLHWGEAELVNPADGETCLKTPTGLRVDLWTRFPAYTLLSQCVLCLTTVGANTAELGSLAVPMVVLLPTQQMDVMRAWDGIPGLLANLPGVGTTFASLINWLVLRQGKLLAWPNIWAKREIVPELVGELQPGAIAAMVIDFLEHPEKLAEIRHNLRAVRGQPGAAAKLVQLVEAVLDD